MKFIFPGKGRQVFGKRIPIQLALLWVCLCFACSAGIAGDLRSDNHGLIAQQLIKIDTLLAAGELEKGLALAKKVEAKYGNHELYGWQVNGKLGLALILMDRYSESVPYLEEAIRANPREPVFHRNLASALVSLGFMGRALSEYSQAVELEPDNSTYQLDLGQLLLEFKNYSQAQFHLEWASRLCKGCVETERALGHLFLAIGKPSEAIPIFQALLTDNRSNSSRRDLVQALQSAAEDSLLVELLGNWPADQLPGDELHLLINAERRCGNYFCADSFLQRRLNSNGKGIPPIIFNRHQFWGEVAYSLLLAGKLSEARKGFELALELDPGNPTYSNNLQVVVQRLKQRKSKK